MLEIVVNIGIFWPQECNCETFLASTACSPNPMDIIYQSVQSFLEDNTLDAFSHVIVEH